MNIERLCKGCMRQMDTPGGICPRCGYDNKKPEKRSIKCLPEYTILNGRYMIGRVLGEGGFGITYLALDLINETPVAVKEYFPTGLAARDSTDGTGETLVMLDEERERYYQDGLQKFALEGRNLSQLKRQPGIVTALDFFEANGTAYLVMEFIEGQSLKQYMHWYQQDRDNKPIDYPVAIAFLEPVMKALIEVHRVGLIHRDISPDNILVDKNGKVTLIDFGAARVGVKENELRSMTIMVKHGYAPQEQYRTHGKQGPWTDVYALCATLYHMISGELPLDSVERMYNDELIPLKNLDLPVLVPVVISDILEKGMKIRPEERYQTMEELYQDLKQAQEEVEVREKEQERERLEAERMERERLEAERMERERLERERFETERIESARLKAERLKAERLETEQLESELSEKAQQEREELQEEIIKEQKEALSEQTEAPGEQTETLIQQERLRLAKRKKTDELLLKEEQKRSRQKKMLYGIEVVAAVAVIAVGIKIFHTNFSGQNEFLPTTAQIRTTETEPEPITAAEAENTAANETENVVATEAVTEKPDREETEKATGKDTDKATEKVAELIAEAKVSEQRPEYTALDYVTLGEYKGLNVQIEPVEVMDSYIDIVVNEELISKGLRDMEDTVENGDTVNIDYAGTKDGVAFDGGTYQGYDLVIGSNSFIDGFEAGLVGVKAGETVELNLTFPEDYQSEDLAGQDVVFTVTVNYIVPEVTDELASQLSDGAYTTVDSYRESIAAKLEEEQLNSEIYNSVMTQVYNTCTINEYPQDLMDYYMALVRNTYENYAAFSGMELSEFLEACGMTDEDFQNEIEKGAKQEMILKAIAEQEGLIDISEEEYDEGCANYAEANGYETVDEFLAAYDRAAIETVLVMDKTLEYLKDNAVVEIG